MEDGNHKFLREFTRLAGTYLACRLKVFGGALLGDTHGRSLHFSLLGMHDYEQEMKLLVREALIESKVTRATVLG